MTNNTMLYAASLCAAVALVLKWQRGRSRPPYPPGPREYPLVGSILGIPRDVPIWKGFMSIAKELDTSVLYLKLFSTDFVVLHSSEDICNLLEGRSNIYSDRPIVPMLDLMDIYSWDIISLARYGSQWRRSRRLFHEFFNAKAVTAFDDHQRKYAYRFLSLLAQTPENFLDHAKFVTGALIMEITYGLDIKSHEDKYLRTAEDAMESLGKITVPGAFFVDIFPILRHVPEWFPGAGFKRLAKETGRLFGMAVNDPFDYMKSLKSKGSKVSIASSCFDRVVELQDQGFNEGDVRAVTATTYIGGTDTTTSVLRGFFLVMALYPHVMRKAQEELDRVVGNERLPEFSDWENLPYISAILKELFRWACPLPIGFTKRAMEDGIYQGYLIPAGTNILDNIWAICYDEAVYPSPYTYDPERFLKDGVLDSSVKDPEDRIFGSGRRLCPGRHFALRTLFLNIACTLAVFDISAPVGEKLEAKYREGLIRHPLPFKCEINPRSVASLKLIRDAGTMADQMHA